MTHRTRRLTIVWRLPFESKGTVALLYIGHLAAIHKARFSVVSFVARVHLHENAWFGNCLTLWLFLWNIFLFHFRVPMRVFHGKSTRFQKTGRNHLLYFRNNKASCHFFFFSGRSVSGASEVGSRESMKREDMCKAHRAIKAGELRAIAPDQVCALFTMRQMTRY